MTLSEILDVLEGYRKQMRWQATQTCLIVSSWSEKRITPYQLFPGLFDDFPEQKQNWQIVKERILAHKDDYKRNRGEKI